MIKELVKVATRLDALGLTKEADVVDRLIRKIATDSHMNNHRPGDSGAEDEEVDVDEWEHMRKVKLVMERTGLSELEAEELIDRVEAEEYPYEHAHSEPVSYNPHLHGTPSYEMDTDSIHEGIDSDRELESMFPAQHSFRRSSSTRRGMRKSS